MAVGVGNSTQPEVNWVKRRLCDGGNEFPQQPTSLRNRSQPPERKKNPSLKRKIENFLVEAKHLEFNWKIFHGTTSDGDEWKSNKKSNIVEKSLTSLGNGKFVTFFTQKLCRRRAKIPHTRFSSFLSHRELLPKIECRLDTPGAHIAIVMRKLFHWNSVNESDWRILRSERLNPLLTQRKQQKPSSGDGDDSIFVFHRRERTRREVLWRFNRNCFHLNEF